MGAELSSIVRRAMVCSGREAVDRHCSRECPLPRRISPKADWQKSTRLRRPTAGSGWPLSARKQKLVGYGQSRFMSSRPKRERRSIAPTSGVQRWLVRLWHQAAVDRPIELAPIGFAVGNCDFRRCADQTSARDAVLVVALDFAWAATVEDGIARHIMRCP